MLEILESQKDFLDYHSIPLSQVFDASGLRQRDYKVYMKEFDYAYAIGVTPCQAMGHTLRNSSGHCVQCNPSTIRFRRRYYENGYVYLAGSTSEKVIKVGFANDIDNREESLNKQGYGSIYDWQIIYWVQINEGGSFEYLIQDQLNSYASPRTFIKDGRTNNCLEIFSCSFFKAKGIIDILLDEHMIMPLDEYTNDDLINNYNFRNKKGNFFYVEGNTNKSRIVNITNSLPEDEKIIIDIEEEKIKKKKSIKTKKRKSVNKEIVSKEENNDFKFTYLVIFLIFIIGLYFFIGP